MRKKIVAGNWKMNKNLQEGIVLINELNAALQNAKPSCEVIIAPPFIHLAHAAQLLDGSIIKIGAQNCSRHVSGAFTGDISAEMIKSTGAEYVIIGHSERRQYHCENSEVLTTKLRIALDAGLKPIYCFGEMLDERESGKHFDVIKSQIEEVLFNYSEDDFKNIVLAYEPVWAIGTGKTATSEQAQEIHKFTRDIINAHFGENIANATTILYGGSCKPSNAKELFANPDVDGGLIGGASLVCNDFVGIINAF